jgi:hypothetical protein
MSKQPSALVVAVEDFVRDLNADRIRASFKVIEGDAEVDAHCIRTGACPCVYPCVWGRQALDDLRRDGWPRPDPRLQDDPALEAPLKPSLRLVEGGVEHEHRH